MQGARTTVERITDCLSHFDKMKMEITCFFFAMVVLRVMIFYGLLCVTNISCGPFSTLKIEAAVFALRKTKSRVCANHGLQIRGF
jgi:hypothetical protein